MSRSDEEVLEVLVASDDPVLAEEPGGFDRAGAELSFEQFAEALVVELEVSCEWETGRTIQDAAHHGEITLPEVLLLEPYACSVRASNFGRLCCVYDCDSVVRPEVLEIIERCATEHGYVFVPSRLLDLRYGGDNPGVSGFPSWGARFFDYI